MGWILIIDVKQNKFEKKKHIYVDPYFGLKCIMIHDTRPSQSHARYTTILFLPIFSLFTNSIF